MPLNIDQLLPSQKPAADQDVAVEWGQAVEADIRALDVRAGAPAGPPNGLAVSVYRSFEYDTDSFTGVPWSGTKTNCNTYNNRLYPNNTTVFDGGLLYDSGSAFDNWVSSFSYQTNPVSFNDVYNISGTFGAAGSFLHGNTSITAEYVDPDTGNWVPLPSFVANNTLTFEQIRTQYLRFTITVPQAATGLPSYISGLSFEAYGPQYGESAVIDIPVGGLNYIYQYPYPIPPGAAFFPFFQAGQRLRADIDNMTTTDCRIRLVTDDGVYTPMNGRGLLIVTLG